MRGLNRLGGAPGGLFGNNAAGAGNGAGPALVLNSFGQRGSKVPAEPDARRGLRESMKLKERRMPKGVAVDKHKSELMITPMQVVFQLPITLRQAAISGEE